MTVHIPVLVKEVIQLLEPKSNENFIDGTVGEGGHALEILKRNGPKGRVLGIDWDPNMIEALREQRVDRLLLTQGNYKDMNTKMEVSGVVLDLGLSMMHIKNSGRGFTFKGKEPLDMRYSDEGLTAQDIVNGWSEDKLEKAIELYGEERFAKQIAKAIVEARGDIETNKELVEIIKEATPDWYDRGRIHPATRTFQALRMVVNEELANIEEGLETAWDILRSGGRLAVISYHSLEDRAVKLFLRDKVQKGEACLQNKKPITPSEEEINNNPSSRSAKLRGAVKIS